MDIALQNRRTLDNDYVSEIVGVPVKSFSIAEGAKKGDNVIGKMLALQVILEDDSELKLVIKSILPLTKAEPDVMEIVQAKFFLSLEIFPVEITYYSEIRPLLYDFSGLALDNPRYFSGVSDGVNDFLCLEDLRPKGYKMADKFKGLSLSELNCVLRKLALLHAHSYAAIKDGVLENFQGDVKRLGGHIWDRPIFDLDQSVFFNAIVKKMAEIMRELGEISSADKMEKFTKTSHKIMIDLWRKTGISEGGKVDKYFKVLIHGDAWINNVLYKYRTTASGEEEVEDTVLIDFQQARFGNIQEDLLYLIFTSTTVDFRKQHLRSCLQYYAQEFIEAIDSLPGNVSLPVGFTDEEVIATFYENLEYGFCYNLVGIPFQLGIQAEAPPPQPPTPPSPGSGPPQPPSATEMALGHAEILKQATKNSPIAIKRLKEMVKEMEKLNVLS